jgi:putative hydrolase of the HAD superfamily
VSAIRAVVFDFDGVIRLWDPGATPDIERRHGLDVGTIHDAAFGTVLDDVVCGRTADEAWRAQIRATVERRYGDRGGTAVDEWTMLTGRIDPDVLALAAAVREHKKVALLTNATTRLESELERHQLTDAFDHIFNSSRIGYAKPDPRIYAEAVRRLGVAPGTCVFVDDNATHVEGARKAGWLAIRYTGAEDLRRRLTELRVLR